jgi:hypothetical protein
MGMQPKDTIDHLAHLLLLLLTPGKIAMAQIEEAKDSIGFNP